jgi:ABC-type Mn2+/Zn2+ transport system ATPase subunit
MPLTPLPSAGPTSPGAVLQVEDLSVLLGGLPVLRGISMTVRAGEAVALLGGNGSGKSTLVRSVLGLLPIERGTVSLFGEPLGRFRRWSRVGYVPQRSTAAASGATVAEIVSSGRLSLRRPFLPRSSRDKASVRDALDLVGMGGRARSDVRELSGGQQQRVFIARALLGEPDLILMDEPTSGVDVATRHDFLHLLDDLNRNGLAIVLTTHDLNGMAAHLPHIVCLNRRVIAAGAPSDVLTVDVLEQTYGARMDVLEHAGLPVVIDHWIPAIERLSA